MGNTRVVRMMSQIYARHEKRKRNKSQSVAMHKKGTFILTTQGIEVMASSRVQLGSSTHMLDEVRCHNSTDFVR